MLLLHNFLSITQDWLICRELLIGQDRFVVISLPFVVSLKENDYLCLQNDEINL